MKKDSKNGKYLLDEEEPYILQVGNIEVEMMYTDTNRNFKDCIVNILKQKYKNV